MLYIPLLNADTSNTIPTKDALSSLTATSVSSSSLSTIHQQYHKDYYQKTLTILKQYRSSPSRDRQLYASPYPTVLSPLYGTNTSTSVTATATASAPTPTNTSVSSSSSSSPSVSSSPATNTSAVSPIPPSPSASKQASVSSSGTPSTAADLPSACDKTHGPTMITALTGSIRIGSRSRSLRQQQSIQNHNHQRLNQFVPTDDDATTTNDDDPANTDDDYAGVSSLPSPVPGPGPYLPTGTSCIWVISGGGNQRISLTWRYSYIGLPDDTDCTRSGNALNIYDDDDNLPEPVLLNSVCYYDENTDNTNNYRSPRTIVSNSSTIVVTLFVVAPSSATGFQLDFQVMDPPVLPSITPPSTPIPIPSPSTVNANCTLSPWSAWGNCSVTCGGGIQTRTRDILTPATGNGICYALVDTRVCNLQTCNPNNDPDIDCIVSNWTTWSVCELPDSLIECGNGMQERERTIIQSSSGNGLPCPSPDRLIELRNCSIPCDILPACNSRTRPDTVHTLSGTIGIGSAKESSNPPYHGGDTEGNCGWFIEPYTSGWLPNQGLPFINLTLRWINIPESKNCENQYLRISNAVYNRSNSNNQIIRKEPLYGKLCGSTVPFDIITNQNSLISNAGEGIYVELNTSLNTINNAFIGFEASYTVQSASLPSSSPLPSYVPPVPNTTASASPAVPSATAVPRPNDSTQTTARLTLKGLSRWAALSPTAIINGVRADIANALSISDYRLTAFVYSSSSRQIEFQLINSLEGVGEEAEEKTVSHRRLAEISTYDATVQLFTQLQNSNSNLRRASTTGALDPTVFTVNWGAPASVSFNPANLIITIPYQRSTLPPITYSGSITIRNNGGSTLVIPSVNFLYAGGSGTDPANNPYGTQLLSASTNLFPFTVAAGAQKDFTVSVDGSKIPSTATLSAFAVLQMEHNDPVGAHAVPVTVNIGGVPPSNNNNNNNNNNPSSVSDLLKNDLFRIGAVTGISLFVGTILCILCSYCWCCRRDKDGNTLCVKYCCKSRLRSKNGTNSRMGGLGPNDLADSQGKKKSKDSDRKKDRKKDGNSDSGSDIEINFDSSSSSDEERGKAAKKKKSSKGKKSTSDDDDEDERKGLHSSGSKTKNKGTGSSKNDSHGGEGFLLELTKLKNSSSSTSNNMDNDIGSSSNISITKSGQLSGLSSTVTTITSGGGGGGTNSSSGGSSNLFGGLALSGSFGSSVSSASHNSSSSSSSSSSVFGGSMNNHISITLKAKPVLRAAEFESKWASMATVEIWGTTLKSKPKDGELEKTLNTFNISCMASGTVGDVVKYYFYAQGMTNDTVVPLAIGEVSITNSSLRLSAVIKASNPSMGTAFTDALKTGINATNLVK